MFAVRRAATASTKHTSATAARRSLAASFTSFGCGSAMSAVCASACHRPSIHHLRPSATVAAWHPGPAAPVRGKASIPPGVVSTGSGAALRRDLLGFASAGVHPCPNNGPDHKFQSYFPASTGPASFRADPDHASSFSPPTNCQKKPPPHLINQSRSRPDRRHASFRQTPRRRISDNAIYV